MHHVINDFSLGKMNSFVGFESGYQMVKAWARYFWSPIHYYQNTDASIYKILLKGTHTLEYSR